MRTSCNVPILQYIYTQQRNYVHNANQLHQLYSIKQQFETQY